MPMAGLDFLLKFRDLSQNCFFHPFPPSLISIVDRNYDFVIGCGVEYPIEHCASEKVID